VPVRKPIGYGESWSVAGLRETITVIKQKARPSGRTPASWPAKPFSNFLIKTNFQGGNMESLLTTPETSPEELEALISIGPLLYVHDDDCLTVFDKGMWFGDPFHVLPSAEWETLKATAMSAIREGRPGGIGGVVGVAGGESLVMATAQGGGRFDVYCQGVQQRVVTDSFLLALMPLSVVDFFSTGGRDQGMVIEDFSGRVYINRDTRSWFGSLECETADSVCYERPDPMVRWTRNS
jgi:hypothetical protein